MIVSKPTPRKINKNGKKSATAEFIGTFLKANGEVRTMHFATSEKKISGHIANGTMATVFDVEKKSLRKFNFAKMIGTIAAVN